MHQLPAAEPAAYRPWFPPEGCAGTVAWRGKGGVYAAHCPTLGGAKNTGSRGLTRGHTHKALLDQHTASVAADIFTQQVCGRGVGSAAGKSVEPNFRSFTKFP